LEHNDDANAVPTSDHSIPLLHVAALAAASNETPHVLVDGCAYGSLS
jgi:4,5-DOPA dioxygenase extradiol